MILGHIIAGDTFPTCALKCFISTVIHWLIMVNMGIVALYAVNGCSARRGRIEN